MTKEPLYSYILHCRFGESDKVRVVGATGHTPQEAFRSIIHLWGAAGQAHATLLGVVSEKDISTWER